MGDFLINSELFSFFWHQFSFLSDTSFLCYLVVAPNSSFFFSSQHFLLFVKFLGNYLLPKCIVKYCTSQRHQEKKIPNDSLFLFLFSPDGGEKLRTKSRRKCQCPPAYNFQEGCQRTMKEFLRMKLARKAQWGSDFRTFNGFLFNSIVPN